MTTEYLLANKKTLSAERQQRIERLRACWSQMPSERLAMSVITLGELRSEAPTGNDPARAVARLNVPGKTLIGTAQSIVGYAMKVLSLVWNRGVRERPCDVGLRRQAAE